jgi:hypothetical protein
LYQLFEPSYSGRAVQRRPSPYIPKGQLSADEAWRQSSPFSGTNSVFFGSNGGGNGWASKPQSLYGESMGGWSTAGHEHRAQDPKHLPSVPELGGTNFAFAGADGYHYGWARKAPGAHGQVKQSARAPKAARATMEAAGGWSAHGHEAQPSKNIGSVPELGGTNFAFAGADGYHYGWARKAGGQPAGRVNKDKGVKQVHVAHPKLGWNF